MNAKLKPWKGTLQQILIGLVLATLVVAVIEANSDYDEECGWSLIGTTVTHYSRGDLQRVRIGKGRCRLSVELEGDVDIALDNRGVTRLDPGASLRIKERLRGERRRLDVKRGADGRPAYTWFVNGPQKPFDEEARTWLAEVLPKIYRTTGIDADRRVEQLLQAGGFEAVLEELHELSGDRVERIYLEEVLKRTSTEDDLVRALRFGRDEIRSDYELARGLSALPKEALRSGAVRDAWAEALERVGSDYELRRALVGMLQQGRLEIEVLEALLKAGRTIGSDHEQARLLIQVAESVPGEESLPPSYFHALRSIGSDYEHKRTLTAALGRPGLTEADAQSLLDTALRISSDFELAGLLKGFAIDYPEERPLPDAFYSCLRSISSDSSLRQVLTTVVEHRALDPVTTRELLIAARDISSDYELASFLVQLINASPRGEALPVELEELIAMVGSDFERKKIERALQRLPPVPGPPERAVALPPERPASPSSLPEATDEPAESEGAAESEGPAER